MKPAETKIVKTFEKKEDIPIWIGNKLEAFKKSYPPGEYHADFVGLNLRVIKKAKPLVLLSRDLQRYNIGVNEKYGFINKTTNKVVLTSNYEYYCNLYLVKLREQGNKEKFINLQFFKTFP